MTGSEERIRAARAAADSPETAIERREAIDFAVTLVAKGVPLTEVLEQMFEAGYLTGHMDGSGAAWSPMPRIAVLPQAEYAKAA